MRSFRDEPTQTTTTDEPEYTKEIRAQFYVAAIEALYPAERVNETFWVRDDGDGPFIYKWASDDSEPDAERIEKKIQELFAKWLATEKKQPRQALVDAQNAVSHETFRMVNHGYFEHNGNLIPLRGLVSMESLLTRHLIEPIRTPVPMMVFDGLTKTRKALTIDIETLRAAYIAGSDLMLELDALALKVLNGTVALGDEALARTTRNPKDALDKAGRATTFKVKFPLE